LDEQKMIADIKSGSYSSAWVDAQIKQKGDWDDIEIYFPNR
jgi:hypothetical protein